MDEVGFEAVEGVFDLLGVAPEERVEGEVLLHADGGYGTGEFEELNGVGGDFVRYGSARANAEEREGVALGVGDEVTGGVGYAVYFVERVREVGDSRRTHTITLRCETGGFP